jgi:hypothetical protein
MDQWSFRRGLLFGEGKRRSEGKTFSREWTRKTRIFFLGCVDELILNYFVVCCAGKIVLPGNLRKLCTLAIVRIQTRMLVPLRYT